MILKKITILNYKNIEDTSLVFSPKINCFIGNNGVGKTNLLDAVYYLSFCKSSSNTVDSQAMMHNKDFFVIEGLYNTDQGEDETVYCGMKRGTKKHFKRNKKEYKRLASHIGLIPLVFVSPSDVSLIEGASEDRRRFLDVVISQLDSVYIDALLRYSKALQQRNVLLKQDTEPDETLMQLFETEMAEQGTIIFNKRREFINEFVEVFQDIYKRVSGNNETVSLNYISHGTRGNLLDVISRDRAKDRAVGYSLHGIHRDDLEMLIDGYPMKREGSQGQNKTFVLALKLAQFNFLKRTPSKTTPLLLLDDIFDKLDSSRVERIVNLVAGHNFGQIFITDTNREHLDSILKLGNFDYKLFEVNNGVFTSRADDI